MKKGKEETSPIEKLFVVIGFLLIIGGIFTLPSGGIYGIILGFGILLGYSLISWVSKKINNLKK